jgi:3-hydroxyisobutyrate dehydrogenase-like beta-hydroxyacid dehydrogenase
MAKIAVIGAGYVGVTTAACLAHLDHEVRCTDVQRERVARLCDGDVPIVEEGLSELVHEGLASGRLSFSTDNPSAVRDAGYTFLCVPTPQGDDGRADISYIEVAAREIGPHLPSESVVINKSTVPVGSTKVVERALGRSDVAVVSNPEFLREGSAVHDFLHPDRIVIGADDESTAIKVSGLFLRISAPLVVTDPATAETIKYAANAFLATKVSFVNAVASLCEAVGADIRQVVLGMGSDHRIHDHHYFGQLQPVRRPARFLRRGSLQQWVTWNWTGTTSFSCSRSTPTKKASHGGCPGGKRQTQTRLFGASFCTTVAALQQRLSRPPEPVAWLVEVDPDVWAIDTRGLPEQERETIRETIASWAESGPPEAVTRFVGVGMVHEYEMANGILIKFLTEEDEAEGGLLMVIRVAVRYWFPSD